MRSLKLYAVITILVMAFGVNEVFSNKETLVSDTAHLERTNEAKSLIEDEPMIENGNSSIKVALLLDASGSMMGLIEQAKSQLWQILNQLASTEKNDGQDVNLEIALYVYGNPIHDKRRQIRQLSGFTTDMDLISEKLFALSTNGGEEYCGEVILTSVTDLEWGGNEGDLKMIYIAGNEAFSQGTVHYAKSCQKAKKEGIVVNTIFCGDWKKGVDLLWKQGADLGEGEYMNIDHNKATVHVETPYDEQIDQLNKRLNKTYIPYGEKGREKLQNQLTQDRNAETYSKSNKAERANFKSSKKYKADDWDLVDAYKKDKNVLNNANVSVDSLQNISIEELEAKIEAASTERLQIQKEIRSVNSKRMEYIQNNSNSSLDEKNLKNSIQRSINKQAKKKGYTVKN